jgi:hypothetical protein
MQREYLQIKQESSSVYNPKKESNFSFYALKYPIPHPSTHEHMMKSLGFL